MCGRSAVNTRDREFAREPIDVEYLLIWIARRTDRAVHQAGERSPIEGLGFVGCWSVAGPEQVRAPALTRRASRGGSRRERDIPTSPG